MNNDNLLLEFLDQKKTYEYTKHVKDTANVFYDFQDDHNHKYRIQFKKQRVLGKQVQKVILGQQVPGFTNYKRIIQKFPDPITVLNTIITIFKDHSKNDAAGKQTMGYALVIPSDLFGSYAKLAGKLIARAIKPQFTLVTDEKHASIQPDDDVNFKGNYIYALKTGHNFESVFNGKAIKDAEAAMQAQPDSPTQNEPEANQEPVLKPEEPKQEEPQTAFGSMLNQKKTGAQLAQDELQQVQEKFTKGTLVKVNQASVFFQYFKDVGGAGVVKSVQSAVLSGKVQVKVSHPIKDEVYTIAPANLDIISESEYNALVKSSIAPAVASVEVGDYVKVNPIDLMDAQQATFNKFGNVGVVINVDGDAIKVMPGGLAAGCIVFDDMVEKITKAEFDAAIQSVKNNNQNNTDSIDPLAEAKAKFPVGSFVQISDASLMYDEFPGHVGEVTGHKISDKTGKPQCHVKNEKTGDEFWMMVDNLIPITYDQYKDAYYAAIDSELKYGVGDYVQIYVGAINPDKETMIANIHKNGDIVKIVDVDTNSINDRPYRVTDDLSDDLNSYNDLDWIGNGDIIKQVDSSELPKQDVYAQAADLYNEPNGIKQGDHVVINVMEIPNIPDSLIDKIVYHGSVGEVLFANPDFDEYKVTVTGDINDFFYCPSAALSVISKEEFEFAMNNSKAIVDFNKGKYNQSGNTQTFNKGDKVSIDTSNLGDYAKGLFSNTGNTGYIVSGPDIDKDYEVAPNKGDVSGFYVDVSNLTKIEDDATPVSSSTDFASMTLEQAKAAFPNGTFVKLEDNSKFVSQFSATQMIGVVAGVVQIGDSIYIKTTQLKTGSTFKVNIQSIKEIVSKDDAIASMHYMDAEMASAHKKFPIGTHVKIADSSASAKWFTDSKGVGVVVGHHIEGDKYVASVQVPNGTFNAPVKHSKLKTITSHQANELMNTQTHTPVDAELDALKKKYPVGAYVRVDKNKSSNASNFSDTNYVGVVKSVAAIPLAGGNSYIVYVTNPKTDVAYPFMDSEIYKVLTPAQAMNLYSGLQYAQDTTKYQSDTLKDLKTGNYVNGINYTSLSPEVKKFLVDNPPVIAGTKDIVSKDILKPYYDLNQKEVAFGPLKLKMEVNYSIMKTQLDQISSMFSKDVAEKMANQYVGMVESNYNKAFFSFSNEFRIKTGLQEVRDYTGANYKYINNYIRGRTLEKDDGCEHYVKSIDAAYEKSGVRLPDDVIVYRGQSLKPETFDAIMKGGEYIMHGYTSTSLGYDTALGFSKAGANYGSVYGFGGDGYNNLANEGKKPVFFIISHLSNTLALIPGYDSKHQHELEIILNRGTIIKKKPNGVVLDLPKLFVIEMVVTGIGNSLTEAEDQGGNYRSFADFSKEIKMSAIKTNEVAVLDYLQDNFDVKTIDLNSPEYTDPTNPNYSNPDRFNDSED